jgi:MFS family permease
MAWTYSQIIFFSLIPGICAIILILTVKDVDPTKLDERKLRFYGHPKVDKIDKNFIKLIIILGVIEFASLDIAFLIIRSTDYISSELIFLIPLFYLLSNVVYVIFSPINGLLSDKIGRKPVIVLGLLLLLISCVLLAFPTDVSLNSLVLIIFIYFMFGFYLAAVDPISRAYIADLAGKNKRGRAYGYYYLSVGLISLAESIIFSLIYEIYSFTWAFIYISIMLFICIVVFIMTDFSKIIEKKDLS